MISSGIALIKLLEVWKNPNSYFCKTTQRDSNPALLTKMCLQNKSLFLSWALVSYNDGISSLI